MERIAVSATKYAILADYKENVEYGKLAKALIEQLKPNLVWRSIYKLLRHLYYFQNPEPNNRAPLFFPIPKYGDTEFEREGIGLSEDELIIYIVCYNIVLNNYKNNGSYLMFWNNDFPTGEYCVKLHNEPILS